MSAPDPFAAFRDLRLPGLGRLYETTPLEPFSISATATSFGPVGLAYVRVTSQRWERTPALIRETDLDPFIINVRFAGGGLGDYDGRDLRASSGSIVISDLTRKQAHDSDRSHTASLALPRAMVEAMVPDARTLHGLVIAPPQAALLRNFLADLERRLAGLPGSAAPALGSALTSLLGVTLAAVAPARRPSRDALATAARLAAEQAITDRLGSPSMTVAWLSRRLGISRSTLYRLFEAEGGPQNYIRARRLERVAAELARPGNARIADIAERWGFCDAAYLGRVFRETFGVTPGDYRAEQAEG